MKNRNPYDEQEYSAFVLNGSRISTDDREIEEMDEFSADFMLSSYDEESTEPR